MFKAGVKILLRLRSEIRDWKNADTKKAIKLLMVGGGGAQETRFIYVHHDCVPNESMILLSGICR